jgi:aminoglycoside phosphotransferase (APT) family kinase protein
VVVQSLLRGAIPGVPDASLVDDVIGASLLLADVDGVPTLHGMDWPALLRHSLLVGEAGWCRHEPMRAFSARTSRLLEHVLAVGRALDVASVPTSDVVHLDLHPANLLVDGGRLSGMVDWDAALPGDRWFDLLYFAHHAAGWWGSPSAVVAPLWSAIEVAVPPALLRAYAAHIALRTVEWQVSRHTAADVERSLGHAERLVARYP